MLLRHRVTGPEAEPPFQINNSWIHPRVVGIPGVAGHGPLSWPVLEIVRVGRSASDGEPVHELHRDESAT